VTAPAAFFFDAADGTLRGPTGWPRPVGLAEVESWRLCEHLRPALAALLAEGASIVAVTGPGAWTRIDLDVTLDAGPAGGGMPAGQAAALSAWSNTDAHYPLQSGLSCAACRQTLSWPLV